MDYYYLSTALPELKLGAPPEISFADFVFLMRENLSEKDLEKTHVIRLFFDIENMRNFWRKEPLDLHGNFDFNAMEEALLTGSGFPSYVYNFLEKHDELQDRLRHFPFLIAAFFREEIAKADGFLKKYLTFERELRLVLVAFRAKKMGRDILAEMQYENLDDDLVAQILSQKDAKTYDPPEKYEILKPLYEELSDDPAALNKALFEYRFQKVDEMVGLQVFTIDYILAYFIKLIYVEKWLEQSREKGIQIIKKIIEGAS